MTLDKTFDFVTAEQELYPHWEQSGVFGANPESDKSPFTIMMPPPNVTGALHVGHALVNTLQDVLIRYHRMKGKDALWMPGTDHAGIATQMVVERKLEAEGVKRKDLGREAFVDKIWEWKEESGGTIVKQLRKLGTTPDWPRERFTMDDGLSKAVRKVFCMLYEDGLIYKDNRLVNWDPKLQTAVSDLEVEHKDVKGKMYHVKYMFEDGSGSISIATTRPETILADGAIAVHPDDEKYKKLVGRNVVVPVANRIIPIIADEYVKAEFGSGAVKITAAHDYNDFEVYKRHKDVTEIPLINLMTPDGLMNENCPEAYQGLDRFEARKKIIADLDELEYLEKVEDHVHQVPYSERTGVVIEPYLTDQWYCDAPKLGVEATKAVEDGRTEFVPKQWENTYFSWMRDLQPWCISRQLWWGHQIPAWYGPDGKFFVAETEEEAQSQANTHYGETVTLNRETDVLDTWFSSALWPFSTLGWPDKTAELDKYYPGDVLVTGFDIIFFWVARMMMMGLYVMKDVPFKTVYMHGLVRDAHGQKMSKSKGNVMDPLEITEKYGADALRFTLCALSGQGRDIKLAEQRLEGYRNFSTKLWNAARFCEMNDALPCKGFEPKHAINQWIVDEVMSVTQSLDTAFGQYRFNDAANGVYHFVWGTFCDWYLEFTKPLLDDAEFAEETKATTGWVLGQILKLLNPFMPYVTETLYKEFYKNDKLLMAQDWPEYDNNYRFPKAHSEIMWLQRVIGEIRSVRQDMNVPASAKINLLVKGADNTVVSNLNAHKLVMQKMARLEEFEFVSNMPKGAVQTVVGDTTYGLPVADIIDLDKERARLQKEIGKLQKDIKQIEGKLNNKGFVQNAPDDVIEEQKHRKVEAVQIIEKLESALKQIG
jgi:valyl-tRNA synthetase